jgi:DNA polymerase-3 subunit delta'
MSFKAIKGQDKPIHILQCYIEQSRLEGGYLFIGPEGVGKRLVAKTLAKAVNCLEDGLDACDRCASCIKIENNRHPDVHIIEDVEPEINPVRSTTQLNTSEKASNGIKIESIRQLQRDISLKPYEGKRKVFIIDNAHKLTAEAQSAVLKILEEPPKGSLIILLSDKPALLFKTIVSRCKMLKFFPLKRTELKEIFKKDYSLDNNTAHFLAYFSEGRFGRALRLKDRDALGEKNRVINKFILSPPYNLENLAIQNREDVRNYLNILASWFRDIYLIKIGMPFSEIINFDRKDELLRLMGRFSFLDLNEILYSISDSISYLERNINLKLLLYDLRSLLWKA